MRTKKAEAEKVEGGWKVTYHNSFFIEGCVKGFILKRFKKEGLKIKKDEINKTKIVTHKLIRKWYWEK